MIELKGMTWSHDRGITPLVAASKIFKEKYDVNISWDARSLADFELYPLDKLADKYDFIMIDHPHIGVSYAQKLLTPLDDIIEKGVLQNQKQGSVGQSYDSYTWDGKQYALPLDAAAQVSAIRKDIIQDVPVTFEDVTRLANSLPNKQKIAIPFVEVHAYSSFFTLCSHFSKQLFWTNECDLDIEVGMKVMDTLAEILKVSDPVSFYSDPIDILEMMASENRIVYSPLIYGYSNYSRVDYDKKHVEFYNMPKENEKCSGSMIGGVGLSITSKCKHMDEAAKFATMVCDPDFQRTVLFDNGGQPGHMVAWQDENVNDKSYNFFKNTLETLNNGSMRPRFDGYIDFQAEAGSRIRKFILDEKTDTKDFIIKLNELIKKCRQNNGLK